MNFNFLNQKSSEIRIGILEMAAKSGKAHLGGTFSCVDILVALYYGGFLTPKSTSPIRPRFILSKGHACMALYSIFLDLGLLDKKRVESYGKNGGLGGQIDLSIRSIDNNTGSLGHAVGLAAGMALAAKIDCADFPIFILTGDAEMYEGSVWEAMMFSSQLKLKNIVLIIDRNRLSVTAPLEEEGPFEKFPEKVKSFGWNFRQVNGHNFKDLIRALNEVKKSKKLTVINANTIKGKGVSFMENQIRWHHGVPSPELLEKARKELLGTEEV